MSAILARVLAGLLLLSLLFGGWNWYRKNVYYAALQQAGQDRAKAATKATSDMQRAANLTAGILWEKHRARTAALQAQLDYLRDHPVVRTEYVVRDRWLAHACPAGAAGAAGDVPGPGSGLHPELERYALRAFESADGIVEERNACVALYERARAAALKWNRQHAN